VPQGKAGNVNLWLHAILLIGERAEVAWLFEGQGDPESAFERPPPDIRLETKPGGRAAVSPSLSAPKAGKEFAWKGNVPGPVKSPHREERSFPGLPRGVDFCGPKRFQPFRRKEFIRKRETVSF
jgi:hypothetical protein